MEKIYAQIQPVIKKVSPVLRAAHPFAVKAAEHGKKAFVMVSPYLNQANRELIWAFVLLFFGGHFAMTIACYTAFKLTGYKIMSSSWDKLVSEYKDSMKKLSSNEEAKKLLDANGDGEVSGYEVFHAIEFWAQASKPSEKEKAKKSISYIFQAINPQVVTEIVLGFWTGLIAVITTLRSKFAQSVAVGQMIGECGFEFFESRANIFFQKNYPDHIKWCDTTLRAACTVVGIIFSMVMWRIVAAFNSALNGARVISKFGLEYLHSHGMLKQQIAMDSQNGQLIVCAVMMIGFCWQLFSAFQLNWLLWFGLIPFVFVESCLQFLPVLVG